jgi:predicted nucleic acid-binding protein
MNSPTPKRRRPCATGSRVRQAGWTCGRLIRAPDDVAVAKLDEGERAAIALALAVKAELVLMDDREGVGIARGCGLAVTGTLGVLDLAARRGLIDLAAAFERLKTTTFYYRQGVLDALLAQHATRRG